MRKRVNELERYRNYKHIYTLKNRHTKINQNMTVWRKRKTTQG